MGAITREAAFEIARREVARLASNAGDSFELLPDETQDTGAGWVFFFNSSDFVRSGNPVDALAGNGPLLVLHDGQVHHLSSSVSWQEALKQI